MMRQQTYNVYPRAGLSSSHVSQTRLACGLFMYHIVHYVLFRSRAHLFSSIIFPSLCFPSCCSSVTARPTPPLLRPFHSIFFYVLYATTLRAFRPFSQFVQYDAHIHKRCI